MHSIDVLISSFVNLKINWENWETTEDLFEATKIDLKAIAPELINNLIKDNKICESQ